MGYKWNLDRLSKQEIQYELKIRGCDISGNLVELKSTLREILANEAKGILKPRPAYPFVFSQDHQAVKSLVSEIDKNIQQFAVKPIIGLSLKIETKLSHALGRLDNSIVEQGDDSSQKESLMTEIAILMSRYELTFKRSSVVVDEDVDNSVGLVKHVRDVAPTNVDLSVSKAKDNSYVKPTPVMKWDLKFSGDPKGLSLNAFLERVDELTVARNVGKVQLFREACDLFVGKALVWFRANRDIVKSWEELVTHLRLEFQPVNYDERLLEEIKRRTQGVDESMGIYVAIMSNMFSRLSDSLSEERKLSILCRNILPFYQTQLGLTEIDSVQDLIRYGRKIEERRYAVDSYVPPSRRKGDLEPDLAYIETKMPLNASDLENNVSTIVGQRFNSDDNTQRDNHTSSDNKCWNCGSPNHRAGRCSEPRTKRFCFRCGMPDVTVNTCSKCSMNRRGSGNYRTSH